MDAFLTRGWDIVLPGWRGLYEYQVGISTLWEVVSTLMETTAFVPGLLEFYEMVGVVDVWKHF